MNGFNQSFTGECSAIDDVEGAGIEREAACVLDPKRPQGWLIGVRCPERDFIGLDSRLQDRNERRLIFANGDRLFDVVFEVVTEFLGLRDLSVLKLRELIESIKTPASHWNRH